MKNLTVSKTKSNLINIGAYFSSVKLLSILILVFSVNQSKASNYYWVGGSGNWSDYANHWATTSGGVIFHTTVPGPSDDVFFDANSFQSLDTVTIDLSLIYCSNIVWSGATNFPLFYGNQKTLNVYGSMTLIHDMDFYVSTINFKASVVGKQIVTGNLNFTHPCQFFFDGIGGQWLLQDSLNGIGSIYFLNGSFNTNGNYVAVGDIHADNWQPINLDLGASTIQCNSWNAGDSTYLTLNALSATIYGHNLTCGKGQHYNNVISTLTTVGKFNTFNSVISKTLNCTTCVANQINLQTIFYGDNNLANLITFSGNGSITGTGNIIGKAVFNGPASIESLNITFDSLIFNGQGQIINIAGNTYINNYLYTNPQAGFPTHIQSAAPGIQSTLSSPSGNTICLEYVYLQDINATGGASFYAGNYSVDLGNNSGWIWSGCTPDTSNVWPGDANYDLTADNNDVLYIGLAYGYTGPTRAGATTNWIAQPGVDWLQQFANGSNIKHADCDGNGTINASDTLAVSINYGQTHPAKPPINIQPNNSGVPLYFDLPTGALVPGSVVSIPIMFGNAMQTVNNLYGIAFTVNYDPAFVQAGTMQIDFTNSWLGNNLNTIHLTKDFYSTGNIDMGFVKTDHLNTSGNGQFATLTFTVANGVSGLTNLSFSKIFAIDKNEFPISVTPISGSVYTSLNENPALQNMISVYPNPASTSVTINDLNNIVKQIELMDVTGRIVYTQNIQSTNSNNKFELSMNDFTNGIYFLRIETSKGVLNEKLVVKK